MTSTPSQSTPSPPSTSIFQLIHELHLTIIRSIDTSLIWEQLNSPPINYTLVRPIVDRFCPKPDNEKVAAPKTDLLVVPRAAEGVESGATKSQLEIGGNVPLGGILYALMVNRIQFINLAASDLSYAPLQTSRAAFCELLAMKVLRTFPHPEDEADLVGELVRGWCAFDGAPEAVWKSMGDERKDIKATQGSALELAIVSTSKHFLSLPLIQHLVNEIYLGHLIYSPTSSRSFISDSYISERTRLRRRHSQSRSRSPIAASGVIGKAVQEDGNPEVYAYNPYEAGWLDHQRLRVPKWRKWLEFVSFAILLGLFIATLTFRDFGHLTVIEIIFIIFTFGFMLEELAASKEHGWTVYAANAWNAFDLTYIAIFLLYLILRVFAVVSHTPSTSDLAFDILSCAACVLFPRLVFFLIKDNVIVLALKVMIARFVGFMGLVIVAFSGIGFCLWTLGRQTWTVRQIVWLMLQIWFGSSYLGFAASESFHPIFGPIILISYAALCNVLLITILISILSNVFAEINQNAQEEHLFQRVVKTVEGVKSDAVFSYLPPINIVAFITLLPLSWVCSPRTLHRINVFAIRLTSFPILIAISAYERWQYHAKQRTLHLGTSSREMIQQPSLFNSFLGAGSEVLIASVFEAGPPPALLARSGSTTPPRASILSADRDETEDKDRSRQETWTFDSPLAKLFGKTAAIPKVPGKEQGSEVDVLKGEIREMRESQLRMEELLSKVLAGGGK